MPTFSIRVKEETRTLLRELAQETSEPVQELLAKAVEAYRRQRILELTNQAYAALRADQASWQEVAEERAVWDDALGDGVATE